MEFNGPTAATESAFDVCTGSEPASATAYFYGNAASNVTRSVQSELFSIHVHLLENSIILPAHSTLRAIEVLLEFIVNDPCLLGSSVTIKCLKSYDCL